MRVRIHRGANEIGGSCVEVEAAGHRILIDAGMPLKLPKEKSIPAIPQFDVASLCAILISHPHLDHFGLLPWLPSVPVVMGAAARRILRAAAPYMKQQSMALDGPDWIDRRPLQTGPFCVTPYRVDHSAYDAYALLVEAEGKRLLYSGDFRLHGRKRSQMQQLMAAPPLGIDVLLLEGTTLGRAGPDVAPVTEDELEDEFQRRFDETLGLALVQCSAQNIDRLVTIYRACIKTNRTLVMDLYTAEILAATENPRIPQSDWENVALAIPQRQRLQIKNGGWFESLARHSNHRIYLKQHVARNPRGYALIFRSPWMPDLERSNCLAGACLIHSQWEGYLNEPQSLEVNDWCHRHELSFHQIHTSGHASPNDLREFASAMMPGVVVPIHTERPDRFKDIHPAAITHADNEWWNV